MYFEEDKTIFSMVYGNGMYEVGRESRSDPLRENASGSAVFRHLSFKTEYISRGIFRYLDENECRMFVNLVKNAPNLYNILWPVDFLCTKDISVNHEVLPQEKFYGFTESDPQRMNPKYVFLFSKDKISEIQSLEGILENLRNIYGQGAADRSQWQNYNDCKPLKDMSVEIVKSLLRLNNQGYVFLDFHKSGMYFRKNAFYFDFSTLMFGEKPMVSAKVKDGKYPFEYGYPPFFAEKEIRIDEEIQNFSLAVFLFDLLFGRHPFDGVEHSGQLEETVKQYTWKFQSILDFPVFIFDPEDVRNQVGDMEHFSKLKENWKNCPKSIQNLFQVALSMNVKKGEEVSRRSQKQCPSPKDWLKAFKEAKW